MVLPSLRARQNARHTYSMDCSVDGSSCWRGLEGLPASPQYNPVRAALRLLHACISGALGLAKGRKLDNARLTIYTKRALDAASSATSDGTKHTDKGVVALLKNQLRSFFKLWHGMVEISGWEVVAKLNPETGLYEYVREGCNYIVILVPMRALDILTMSWELGTGKAMSVLCPDNKHRLFFLPLAPRDRRLPPCRLRDARGRRVCGGHGARPLRRWGQVRRRPHRH